LSWRSWLWANYLNVSRNTAFGAALVSGSYVAYFDNTIPSNKLTISTNDNVFFLYLFNGSSFRYNAANAVYNVGNLFEYDCIHNERYY